jgi:hypothetical protein
MRQIVFSGKLQCLGGAVGHAQTAEAAVRKINKIETRSFLAVSMSLFALDLDHVGGAKSHAGAAGNAIVAAGFGKLCKLNVPAVGWAHVKIFAGILNRNHRPVDASDGDPHACDQAPAAFHNVFDHTHIAPIRELRNSGIVNYSDLSN